MADTITRGPGPLIVSDLWWIYLLRLARLSPNIATDIDTAGQLFTKSLRLVADYDFQPILRQFFLNTHA